MGKWRYSFWKERRTKKEEMITMKQESILIKKLKSLTELELQSVLEELASHIRKNKMMDMVATALDTENLHEEVRSLELEIDELEIEKDRLESRMREAVNILECIEELDDDVQKEIDRAISELDA